MSRDDSDAATWLVTGANRGLGLEFARQLAGRGDRVIATARRPGDARDLARLDVRVETLDVSDASSITTLARSLDGVPIDVLVLNAAIGGPDGGIATLRMEDVARAFAVNSIGPLAVTQALLPNLRAGRRRCIAGLSSGLGSISRNTDGGWYAYRASKTALNQLVRTLAEELGREDFICVVVCPGWVRTDMGGPEAPITPEESVSALLRVLDGLGDEGQRKLPRSARETDPLVSDARESSLARPLRKGPR